MRVDKQTDKQADTQTRRSQYFAPLQRVKQLYLRFIFTLAEGNSLVML